GYAELKKRLSGMSPERRFFFAQIQTRFFINVKHEYFSFKYPSLATGPVIRFWGIPKKRAGGALFQ
ncbi:MAG: hypothetical protein D6714_17275, partial [Bacteroidetes bacterium]